MNVAGQQKITVLIGCGNNYDENRGTTFGQFLEN